MLQFVIMDFLFSSLLAHFSLINMFKKFKIRLKRALYAFFRDELERSLGPGLRRELSLQIPYIPRTDLDVVEIKTKIRVPNPVNIFSVFGPRIAYNEALLEAKKDLFERFIKFVAVDSESVMSNIYDDDREIKLSVFVCRPKNTK